ncbi:7TM diverse intracellular signaling domain-containing protein [Mucilaginibacter puniceus]
MKKITLILCLILQYVLAFATKTDTLVINKSGSKFLTNQFFAELEDPGKSLKFEDVFNNPKFHTVKSKLPFLRYSKSAIWLKFTIKNNTNSSVIPITTGRSVIDDFDIYYHNPINHQTTHISPSDLKTNPGFLSQNSTIINWSIDPNTVQTIYIRLKSNMSSTIPIEVHSQDEYLEKSAINQLINGALIGIFWVMALYNLILFAIVRDKSYLYYVVYIIFFGLSQILMLGYGNTLVSGNKQLLNEYAIPFIRIGFGFSMLLFADEFLQLKQNFKKYYKWYLALYILFLLPLVATIIHWASGAYLLITINVFITSIALLYIGFYMYYKGFKPAKFFLSGWGLSLIAILITLARNKGLIPYNHLTANFLTYSAIIELILFSTALADKISFYREQNILSQNSALQIAKENERLITEQNILLENMVKERTQALIETNQNLSVTIENLQSAQQHLIETEKMASLGQLTAGVAHEINNPINFVSANVSPLRLDFNELFNLLKYYQEAATHPENPELLKTAEKFKEEIDPDFIKTEIMGLISGIEDGANRTKEIILSLRTFSRMDKLTLTPANINSSILNTLVLLRSSIPYYIEVKPVLNKLEPLNCYPGKIDQMLINLVDNSIHAIKAKKAHNDESILIVSEDHADHVSIKITDTGIGMTAEVRQRIFEPFYTTKEIGEGTGLGLSIVFGIIEKHKGTIDIQSTYGTGTTIIIKLPKNLEEEPSSEGAIS